jgi:hypothetical protein
VQNELNFSDVWEHGKNLVVANIFVEKFVKQKVLRLEIARLESFSFFILSIWLR